MKKRLKLLHKKVAILFLALLLPASSVWQTLPAGAANDSLWVNGGTLTHEVENTATEDMTFGLSCKRMDITHTLLKNGIPTDYTALNECMVPLEYGSLSASGSYFFPKLAKKAGRLYQSKSRIIPVPQTDSLFMQTYRPDIYGTRYVSKYEHGSIYQQYSNINNGQYAYRASGGGEEQRVKWDDGRDIITMSGQLAVSENGQWMIARTSGGEILRINLETLEVIAAFDTGGGWPSPRGNFEFSISNDGRYGIVSGGVFSAQGNIHLIDFSQCEQGVEQTGEVTPGCGVRDITDYIEDISGGGRRIYKPSFTADNTQIQMNVTIGGEAKRIALIAPGETYSGLDYLALGDSFASGEGDHDDTYYEPGTNVPVSDELPEGEKCHVSRRSYPYLVAQNLGIPSDRFKSVACSGAEMRDISDRSDEYLGQRSRLEKIDRERALIMKNEALNNFTPGRVAQIEFVEKYKPKIATISIGGNDASFAEVIADCAITTIQCDFADPAHPEKRYEKAKRVQQMVDELKDLYEDIHRVSEKTKIYVLGYSKIIKKDGECSSFFGFNGNEREFIDESFGYMNKIVEAAARQAGVEYLDVEDALGESRMCGSNKSTAANGFTFGDDIAPVGNVRFVGAESYHPNQLGHTMIAMRITSKMNFNSCSPGAFRCPDEGIETPDIPGYFTSSSYEPPAWRQTYTGIPLSEEDMYLIGQGGEVRQGYYYDPLSQTVLELHSEPRHLGTYQTDENGSLHAPFTIPEDVPAGYHTLKVKGTLISGEEVEFHQTILVLGREGDRDNNGVPDAEQECLEAPVAVTDNDSNVVVPPCAEVDEVFTEPTPPTDETPPNGPIPPLERIIQQARQIVERVFRGSSAYQRLSLADRQRMDDMLERRTVPQISRLLTQCYAQSTDKVAIDIGILKVAIHCREHENGIQLNVTLYIGTIMFPLTNMQIKLNGEGNEENG